MLKGYRFLKGKFNGISKYKIKTPKYQTFFTEFVNLETRKGNSFPELPL